ncbi:epoxide hydrolase N-terminal domain-containing protein [Paraburkholderia sp.]|uniref:epoxide hydrolase N-terminal domain-containing protein n=1 Tax=Paraburkholderia sp. TaxID=1926495 RepID=UPI003D6E63D4
MKLDGPRGTKGKITPGPVRGRAFWVRGRACVVGIYDDFGKRNREDWHHWRRIADTAIEDVRRRVAATRWPDDPGNEDWSYGVNATYLRGLADTTVTDFHGPDKCVDGLGRSIIHPRERRNHTSLVYLLSETQ